MLLTGKDGGEGGGSISKNLMALLESRGSGFTGGLSYGFTLSKSILIYDRTILVVSVQCSVHVFGDNLVGGFKGLCAKFQATVFFGVQFFMSTYILTKT